jgi:hypothetical protein
MSEEQIAPVETEGTPADAELSEETSPEEKAAAAEAERKALLDKHAQQGRDLKAEREARVKAERRTAELEEEREKTRYEKMDVDEQAEYRRQKETTEREAPKSQNLTNEKDLLLVLAETDDPKITKALSSLYYRSEARGKFPDKDTVLAFVEGLTPETEEEDEPKKKDPPKVTASRGTRTVEPSVDEEVKAIEASLKKKDGKFQYGDLLVARQKRDALARATK